MASEDSMESARFEALIASWGADPARWPAGEADAARRHLAASPEAAARLAAEARLDALLDGVAVPTAPAALVGRLLAEAPAAPAPRGLLAPLLVFWRPASGLALAAALGLAVGLSGLDRPEAMALDVDVDIVGFAFAEGEAETAGETDG